MPFFRTSWGCWRPKFSNFLQFSQIGLSLALFWRAFGISGGGVTLQTPHRYSTGCVAIRKSDRPCRTCTGFSPYLCQSGRSTLDVLSVMLRLVRLNTLDALCQLQVIIMTVLLKQCVENAVFFVQWNNLSSSGRRLPYVFLSCGHMFGIWQRIRRRQLRRQIS